MAGIVIGLILALLVISVVFVAFGVALAMFGIIPPPSAGPAGIG